MMSRVASAGWQHIGITSLGLIIFFAVFTLALAWVFRARAKTSYEKISHLPLEDDTQEARSHE